MNTRSFAKYFGILTLLGFLAACGGGGGGDEPATIPGMATIGAAGGTVVGEGGAQVVLPKNALRGDVTVRIAKDSTGAPPLPPSAIAAGAVYSITPHGGAFDDFVEVSIPVEHPDQAGNGQLLLVTAEPGDTQWRVLSGASYHDGKMRAPVLHFSFFQTIRLVNQVMPALVTKIDGANNVGAPGTPLLSALQNLPFLKTDPYSRCSGGCPIPVNTLVAELSLPAARPAATQLGLTPPTNCRPVDLGHGAMSFRFLREGSQEFFPTVDHPAVVPRDPWPRFPGDGGALTFTTNTTIGRGTFPGFGAIHYYGNESPRIFGLYDANPPTQAMRDRADAEQNSTAGRYVLPVGNVYALPPTGDNPADNLYTWGGSVWWLATQNGSVRIDAAIMTTCGLLLEAVPLMFKLNAPPPRGYATTSIFPVSWTEANGAAEGTDVTLQFARYDHVQKRWTSYDADITSYRVDFSPDPTTVDWQPAAASAVTRRLFQFFDYHTSSNVDAAGVQLSLPAVQASQAGWYRVFYCETTGCFASEAYRLIVLRAPPTITAQPGGQTVQVGQSASFTVATTGAPLPALQWQKRSFLAAAFGFLAWTNIDGAIGATYTTPPLTMTDTATQYRAWATNALGSVASDFAMLTVVEQLAPPVVQSQPGSLNSVAGSTAVFVATVSGTAPLSYQWQRNGSNVTGANSPILTLSNVTAQNDGRYELVITNSAGSVTSQPATLVVTTGTSAALAPTIAAPPASITVAVGNAANFAVAVNGTGPYTYLWMKNGVQAPIPNGDGPSFGIASVTAADAGSYTVRVTNSVGTVLSAAATLTVTPGPSAPVAPAITTQPAGLAVMPGAGATFAVAVTGTAPFSYQWRRNGAAIAGATGAVLHIAAVTALDAGQYAVEVGNAVGVTSSNAAPLIVIGAPAITQQPAAATAAAAAGTTALFSVGATGDGVRYQWTRNQVAIAGATSASYTTPALTLADNGAAYGVIVYNGAGLAFSQTTVLNVTLTYAIGGTVSGLTGTGLVLQNNGGDNLAVAANSSTFTFTAAIAAGAPYAVTVLTQPSGQTCTVQNGSGTANANVTNVAVACVAAAVGNWGAAVAISVAGKNAYEPALGASIDGYTTLAWQQYDADQSNGYASRFDPANGWQGSELFENLATNTSQSLSSGVYSPRVAMGANQRAHIVFGFSVQPGSYHTGMARYTGSAWDSQMLTFFGSGNSNDAALSFTGDGNTALMMYSQYDGARYAIRSQAYQYGNGALASLSPDGGVSPGSSGSSAAAALGSSDAVGTWIAQSQFVYVNRFNGATQTWGVPVNLNASSTGNAYPHAIAGNAGGNAAVVWLDLNSGYRVYASRLSGAAWSTPVTLATEAEGAPRNFDTSGVSVATGLDTSGNAYFAWGQGDLVSPFTIRLYVSRCAIGQPMSACESRIQMDTQNDRMGRPGMAVAPNGDVWVAWVASTATGSEVRIRQRNSTGWSAVVTLGSSAGTTVAPSIAIDGLNRVTVAWEGADRRIYVARHQ